MAVLTHAGAGGNLHSMWTLQRMDPDRRRRRLQLLAERAGARLARERLLLGQNKGDRLRELIAVRRRLVG